MNRAPLTPSEGAVLLQSLTDAVIAGKRDVHGFGPQLNLIGEGYQRIDPATMDLPALPQRPILGGDYVRRPNPEPSHAGFCALCQDCPHRLAAPLIPATGASA